MYLTAEPQKYMKQKLTELKEETDNSTMIVRDLNKHFQ